MLVLPTAKANDNPNSFTQLPSHFGPALPPFKGSCPYERIHGNQGTVVHLSIQKRDGDKGKWVEELNNELVCEGRELHSCILGLV